MLTSRWLRRCSRSSRTHILSSTSRARSFPKPARNQDCRIRRTNSFLGRAEAASVLPSLLLSTLRQLGRVTNDEPLQILSLARTDVVVTVLLPLLASLAELVRKLAEEEIEIGRAVGEGLGEVVVDLQEYSRQLQAGRGEEIAELTSLTPGCLLLYAILVANKSRYFLLCSRSSFLLSSHPLSR